MPAISARYHLSCEHHLELQIITEAFLEHLKACGVTSEYLIKNVSFHLDINFLNPVYMLKLPQPLPACLTSSLIKQNETPYHLQRNCQTIFSNTTPHKNPYAFFFFFPWSVSSRFLFFNRSLLLKTISSK